jgi:hypothetical protein
MVKICGSQCGRIFMLGNDNNLYELDYFNTSSSFALSIPFSDRSSGGDNFYSDGGARKCRKINHFAWNWKLTNILPNLLSTLGFGSVNMDDSFVDLVVDNVRCVLYAITSHGKLTVLYLGPKGDASHLIDQSFDVLNGTKLYLQSNSMRGAGTQQLSASVFADTTNESLCVVGMFPVSLTDSHDLHLSIVLACGIRIYVSLQTQLDVNFFLPNTINRHSNYDNQMRIPEAIAVKAVRPPPSATTVSKCLRDDSTGILDKLLSLY